jgi:hypothetical protein
MLLLPALSFALALNTQPSQRCPDAVTAAVARETGIRIGSPGRGAVVSAACTVWPHDERIILSAFAFDQGAEDEKTLVVALVERRSHRVISSYRRRVGEDAAVQFGERSLAIDVGRYQLARGVRAFGVRFTSAARGPSCPQGAWEEELTLFVPAGATLRPVLQGLPMTRWLARTGCFGGSSTGPIVHDEARLYLILAPGSSNGFRDLVVQAKIVRRTGSGAEESRTERHTLRYDGSEYREGRNVPWWLTLFRPE